MVTDQQVLLLRRRIMEGKTQQASAAAAGMAGQLKEAELAAAQQVLVERGVSDMVPLACG